MIPMYNMHANIAGRSSDTRTKSLSFPSGNARLVENQKTPIDKKKSGRYMLYTSFSQPFFFHAPFDLSSLLNEPPPLPTVNSLMLRRYQVSNIPRKRHTVLEYCIRRFATSR